MKDQMRHCIEACLACYSVCLETVTYLQRMETRVDAAHIRLLFNCAEICQTTAGFIRGGSDFNGRACDVCAEVCEPCAQYCDRFLDAPR